MPHSGTWFAWIDGFGTTHTDKLAQKVTIPADCTHAHLAFYLHFDTAETQAGAHDTMTTVVLDSSGTAHPLATWSNTDAAPGFTLRTFDLSAYAGQTVTLRFSGTEDSSLQTSFVIDDASLSTS
ncbi:hypothetical protein SSPO_077930 [Streptomyces antimycoticus]|uniref:MAM domain-containing protein n=1 Tax=Streptomyces antimycoticus TaxID=68175 RepID=A0A499USF9_9ACTN|nr:hypothetical protein SSPO_077930 [Streptomyces antimycoticus]